MRQRIDLAQLLVGSGRSPGATRAYRLGLACMNHWKATARRYLTDVSPETRQAYIRQIRVENSARGVRVALRGLKSNIIEQGMGPGGIGTQGPYDVRKFVLKPPFAKIKGKTIPGYKVIPFSRSGRMGKRATATVDSIVGKMKAASRSGNPYKGPTRIPAGMAKRGKRPGLGTANRPIVIGGVTFHPHAVDRLAGAKIELGSYSGGRQEAKITAFRAMSKRGKPWNSRGVKARRIARRLNWKKIRQIARRAEQQARNS